MSKGKGNRHAQNQRRRARLKEFYQNYRLSNPHTKEYEAQLIDGNMSYYPVGFCCRYRGYLTKGLAEIHKCDMKNCPHFKEVKRDKKGRIITKDYLNKEEVRRSD